MISNIIEQIEKCVVTLGDMIHNSKNQLFNLFYTNDFKAYEVFSDNTNSKEKCAKNIAAFLKINFLKKNSLNLLDIGPGKGDLTLNLLKILLDTGFELNNIDLVEPSHPLLVKCCSEIEKQKLTYTQVNPINLPIKRFLDNNKKKYHLIIASYVFFWIEKWEVTIKQLLERLDGKGFLCIVLLSNNKDPENAFDLRNKIYKLAHGKNMENAFDLYKVLDKMGLKRYIQKSNYFIKIPHFNALNVEKVNDINQIPTTTKLLIEFLIRCPFEALSISRAKKIIQEISTYLVQNRITHLNCTQDIIWIYKQ